MAPNQCPSCGKSLKPGAVLCIECGFDVRIGERLASQVGSAPGGSRAANVAGSDADREALVCDKFQLCQLQGLGTAILVCDEDEETVACIRQPARPFWTCFTVLVSAPLFFLVPLGLGFLFAVPAKKANWPPGTPLLVVLLTLAVAAGLVATLGSIHLMAPRRRFRIWRDTSRRRLLLQVRETWKFGTANLSVIGADGRQVGRILHRRRRRQYLLLDRFDQPVAVLFAGKVQYTTEWGVDEGFIATCLLGILFGLVSGWYVVFVPGGGRERAYSEWFLYRTSSLAEAPSEKIGRITCNPVREYPYQIDLSADPEQTVDRALVVALMALLPW